MLTSIGRRTLRAAQTDPLTSVYGLARTILAAATASTLAANRWHSLFRPVAGFGDFPGCSGHARISLFCILPMNRLEVARWIGVAILAVVASGWRPRFTGLPHWWVTFSLHASASVTDGGDQVAAILSLVLIPATLADARRTHWDPQREASATPRAVTSRLVGLSALLAIRVQVAGLYAHSAIAKFGVREWADGTALWYWMNDPVFGAPRWVVSPLRNALAVVTITWGTILLELALALALLLPARARRLLLPAGILFHVAIAAILGLVSFGLAMCAALVLYLPPIGAELPRRGARSTGSTPAVDHDAPV